MLRKRDRTVTTPLTVSLREGARFSTTPTDKSPPAPLKRRRTGKKIIMSITAPSQDASILHQLADLPVGWHLANNVGWELGGDEPTARHAATKMLEDLYRDGAIERMFVYCHGRPQACYLLDSNLQALADGAAS